MGGVVRTFPHVLFFHSLYERIYRERDYRVIIYVERDYRGIVNVKRY